MKLFNMRASVVAGGLAATLGLAVSGPVFAASASAQDTAFVTKAAQAGMAEVKLAALAKQKSKTPQVLSFATHMTADHTKANTQLMTIAKAQGYPLPPGVGAKNEALMTKLEGETGSTFDEQYLKSQLPAHQQVLALFQSEAADGTDPQLVAFAKQTIPVIEKHIAMDKQDIAAVGGTVGMHSMAPGMSR